MKMKAKGGGGMAAAAISWRNGNGVAAKNMAAAMKQWRRLSIARSKRNENHEKPSMARKRNGVCWQAKASSVKK
jgi:hypothetical protein